MAGPLNGIAGQQSVSITSPQQQGQNNQGIRENTEQQPEENNVQPREAAAADTQNTQTNDQDTGVQLRVQEQALNSNAPENTQERERGSILDVQV